MRDLIDEFDRRYREAAPLRYARLRPGVDVDAVPDLHARLRVDHLPDDYRELYAWRNGLVNDHDDGWRNEFEDDSWYELIPLDDVDHFCSVEDAVGLVGMWARIREEQGDRCYWKPGMVPFLQGQHHALTVVDTRGHFGGDPGQVVSFDYKCANGWSVEARSLSAWLATQLDLLRRGLFVGVGDDRIDQKYTLLHAADRDYRDRFPPEIPLGA